MLALELESRLFEPQSSALSTVPEVFGTHAAVTGGGLEKPSHAHGCCGVAASLKATSERTWPQEGEEWI